MTSLTIARPQDLDRVLRLVADHHVEEGIALSDDARRGAVLPLLEGSPHGVIYLVGPVRAPIGYAAVSFGWSIEFGGMDGFVDEIYIRPGVRGRGIGSEILSSLPLALARTGMRAIHLEVAHGNERARKLYRKLGFQSREAYGLMTRPL